MERPVLTLLALLGGGRQGPSLRSAASTASLAGGSASPGQQAADAAGAGASGGTPSRAGGGERARRGGAGDAAGAGARLGGGADGELHVPLLGAEEGGGQAASVEAVSSWQAHGRAAGLSGNAV